MNRLRNIIKLVPSIDDIKHGPEFEFTQKIKYMLPRTNFELLGEQLIVGKDNKIGKCDLWLANIPNNFLLSLELKVGDTGDSKKQNFLETQVIRYSDFMKHYYPEDIVYGFGAYKCIKKNKVSTPTPTSIKFIDYKLPTNYIHLNEIIELKSIIKNDCLN
jgi:hypothetical protein